ncbi:MAG: isopentenyl-diphosphate Delta-isomerase [Microthrixaceae bacterium]
MPEFVVLLDAEGNEVGEMEKLAAHQGAGSLHRAFSVFLLDADGRMLLHRRASSKHHFRDLWTNSCCSHPRPGESVADAGSRRVREELGVEVPAVALHEVGSFVYRAEDDDSDLVEHEWDHVLVGRFDGAPDPDPDEVGDWRWVERTDVDRELAEDPSRFTPWFPLALAVLDRGAAPVG